MALVVDSCDERMRLWVALGSGVLGCPQRRQKLALVVGNIGLLCFDGRTGLGGLRRIGLGVALREDLRDAFVLNGLYGLCRRRLRGCC